jgi:hypothetical protein
MRVPLSVRAAWFGHLPEVNQAHYLARPEDLTPVSAVLGDIFRPA